jgi:hypothetical protein
MRIEPVEIYSGIPSVFAPRGLSLKLISVLICEMAAGVASGSVPMLKTIATSLASFAVGTIAMAADWPNLPTKGFIAGRAAEQRDVANGDAIFVAAAGGVVIGKPIPIRIPQYARMHNTHEIVIVVQAEEANGMKIVGTRSADGTTALSLDADLDLLGTQIPHP